MNNRVVLLAQLILVLISLVEAATFMEMVYGLLQIGKEETHINGISYPTIRDGVRRQQIISETIQFPCETKFGRSSSVPNSVHRLRPGDIDVVGGMGDSLVAACGALEEYALGAFIEARGVSWCAGGQDNWRKFVTLPNMLKMFNPNLTGYATGTGELLSTRSKLNVAFPVAATEDALHQARLIVQRIKNDPNIDFKNQWKLITILFGANDICSAQCYSPKKFSPMRHALYLRRALDFLKATLPRTVVNLVPTIDVTVSARVTKSAMCNIIHPLYCACMHQGYRPDIKASKMTVLYQQAVEALISSGRYDKSSDFTVVIQPFTEIFNAPNSDPTKAFRFDSSLITYDCFHFSQKGHALVANLLWNNMMEPVGNKTTSGLLEILERVVCPTEKNPYIFTNVNSKLFYETGSQDGISPRR